jgi:hypothetical protein
MTGQITRTLLFIMMLMTGLSSAHAARLNDAQIAGSEELSLLTDIDSVSKKATIAKTITGISLHSKRPETGIFVSYAKASNIGFTYSTPQSRRDLTRE